MRFTGTLVDQVRLAVISANPNAFERTAEGYVIMTDRGQKIYVDPENGKVISEFWYNYRNAITP
jgi:hypothetical protein